MPTPVASATHDDDDTLRLGVPLVALPTPLAVVGRQWCFPEPVVLHTSHNEWFKSLTVKNTTTHAPFAQIKHTLSAVTHMNPQIEPFAVFHVMDGKTKRLELTVQRESSSSTYEVHNGVLHDDDGAQPCLFAVELHSPPTADGDTVAFRDAATGNQWQATLDGDYQSDRVGVVRVRKGESGLWHAVARICRPKPSLLQSEYYTIEIAAGMDAMLVTILWLARWGEYQRHTPPANVHIVWTSAPFDLTKQVHADAPRNPYRTASGALR